MKINSIKKKQNKEFTEELLRNDILAEYKKWKKEYQTSKIQ